MELEGSRPLSYPHSMPVQVSLVQVDVLVWRILCSCLRPFSHCSAYSRRLVRGKPCHSHISLYKLDLYMAFDGDCRWWYRWRILGIGQLPVRQPENRRAGQCGSGTPERLNRMLCPPKSSREASHSGTKTRRMRVEMLCEFRVEDWLLFPAVHWFSPKCRTGGPVLCARLEVVVRHWPI